VPEWLYKYGNMFSKHKSERILLWKLYNYTIVKLSKPTKVYLLSLVERNSLDI